ncbi:uncharacterized protein C14orf80 homolog isoform X2 [Zootermopsis nevadensis]|uniref:uncharacterized protein C14orf80 homolog isoform X2 n=1 Tax=Zootermopsis nevadensis TaxID=136037 RepID=UPI000B8E8699|nr:uncharacterized protein C14orf80 homolog isoform X2 [Zootermopsis nevadensis]
MSDIKSVIALLCKHVKLSFNVNVKPEHFRLSKFNKTEDSCVCQMWGILYKMCNEVYPHLCDDDVVSFVKLSFAMMKYNSIEFYCLPPDMSSGSRELLLAMGWLMLISDVLEVSTNRKLRESPMSMEFDVKVNQETKSVPLQPVFKAGSLESTLNSILWAAGKIRHNVNAIAETNQARVTFANRVHESTVNSSGLPHLSVIETKLVRYPELLPEYLNSVNDNILLIDTHRQWLKKCSVFWEWMETVIAEKQSDLQINQLGVHDKRILACVLDALRHRMKACILRCQRVRSRNDTSASDEDTDGDTSSSMHDPSARGLPRCILQAKEKDTEMELLLTDSEVQLQEVKSSYKIKKTAILQQIHELARQIENVAVLFPHSLK